MTRSPAAAPSMNFSCSRHACPDTIAALYSNDARATKPTSAVLSIHTAPKRKRRYYGAESARAQNVASWAQARGSMGPRRSLAPALWWWWCCAFLALGDHGAGSRPGAPAEEVVLEAEDFDGDGCWERKRWGENYFAATMHNTFLSRKGFLSAPADHFCQATMSANVQGGVYTPLVRYEALYRYETMFDLYIEQNGTIAFAATYGALSNLKAWDRTRGPQCGPRLVSECRYNAGKVGFIVWEGVDRRVNLHPGPVKLKLRTNTTLSAGQALAGRRNVDVVVLSSNLSDLAMRLEWETDPYKGDDWRWTPQGLPFDGLLTQKNDVFVRVRNVFVDSVPMVLHLPFTVEHSYDSVHLRHPCYPKHSDRPVSCVPTGIDGPGALSIEAASGSTTRWVECGSMMDTLNDGQWRLAAYPLGSNVVLHFTVEFATPEPHSNRLGSGSKRFQVIGSFEARGNLTVSVDADTARTRRVRAVSAEAKEAIMEAENAFVPPNGSTPDELLVYAFTYDSEDNYNVTSGFRRWFGLVQGKSLPSSNNTRALIDVRHVSTPGEMEIYLEQTFVSMGLAAWVRVVSLGDEVLLPRFENSSVATSAFVSWARTGHMQPSQVGCENWHSCVFNTSRTLMHLNPRLYYESSRFARNWGVSQWRSLTAVISKHLPNALVGANFEATDYTTGVAEWVDAFRSQALTLPWTEDYIQNNPIGSPQMQSLRLAMFRAGLRRENRFERLDSRRPQMLGYVMAHAPGNNPKTWRRSLLSQLANGVTMFHLYEFTTSAGRVCGETCATRPQTENYVQPGYGMWGAVRSSLLELGAVEDIITSPSAQLNCDSINCAEVAIYFSSVEDIWVGDASTAENGSSFSVLAVAKRALWVALRHRQLLVDVLVEEDVRNPATMRQYRVIYLTDIHVSEAAGGAIAEWVRAGGHLFRTAGAGTRNELGHSNEALSVLDGVVPGFGAFELDREHVLQWLKQDLFFTTPLDHVSVFPWSKELPAFGAIQRFGDHLDRNATVLARFVSDGGPAAFRKSTGAGATIYCGFLPSIAFFAAAMRPRPIDRCSDSERCFCHYVPSNFSQVAESLIATPLTEATVRPLICASPPWVEVSALVSQDGIVLVLINWSEYATRPQIILSSQSSAAVSLRSALKPQAKIGRNSVAVDLELRPNGDWILSWPEAAPATEDAETIQIRWAGR